VSRSIYYCAKCHYAECSYAECRYAEWHFAEVAMGADHEVLMEVEFYFTDLFPG
jgi:hypothetical protein